MLLFDRLNFSQKIAAFIVGVIIIVMLPSFYVLVSYLDSNLNNYLHSEYSSKVRNVGKQLKLKINLAQNTVFGLKHKLNNIDNLSTIEFDKLSESVSSILVNEESIADIWMILDENCITIAPEYRAALSYSDSMDKSYKYWQMTGAGVLFSQGLFVPKNYFPSIYREIKEFRRPLFGSPIRLNNSQNESVLPVAEPIMQGDKVIGVIGFHLKLSELKSDLDNIVQYNQSNFCAIVSNNQKILSLSSKNKTEDNYLNLKTMFADKYTETIQRAIENGYRYEGVVQFNNQSDDILMLIEPIYFKDKGTSWSIVAGFPNELVLSRSISVSSILLVPMIISLLIVVITILFIFRRKFAPLTEYLKYAERASQGFYLQELPHEYLNDKGEIGELYSTLKMLQDNLRNKENRTLQKFDEQNKYNTGIKQLFEIMRGEQKIDNLSKKVITFLAEFVDAKSGAIYLLNTETGKLELEAAYALDRRKAQHHTVEIGDGILGQAAKEKQMITMDNIPADYLIINSSLGETPAKCIIAAPFMYEDSIMGMIELATYRSFNNAQTSFVKSCLENIAIVFNSVRSNERIKELYNEAQTQAYKLQNQQDELIATNEELEAQTKALIISERKLIEQQEELQAINEELEEKTGFLEKQKAEIIKKNDALVLAQYQLSQKANEVQMASTYKSEFLANMSHELRTPLNSIMILAKNLAEELREKLNDGQIESLGIIYSCGIDLMNLINDILDLSKIEAGKMNIKIAPVETMHIASAIRNNFAKPIQDKNIEFRINIAPDVPKEIETDTMRLEQIIKNFISNSIKFTKDGYIEFAIDLIHTPENLRNKFRDAKVLKFTVKDTGIGIPEDKQRLIFEAFRQIESSLTRKYGGTGLGLSIAKELANVLGGDILLDSKLGKGTTFSLLLPISYITPADKDSVESENSNIQSSVSLAAPKVDNTLINELVQIKQTEATPKVEMLTHLNNMSKDEKYKSIIDDRENTNSDEKSILIVEDDAVFARILTDQVRAKGFKVIFAPSGEEALQVAEIYSPDAVILDIKLPGIDGWEVLRKLKENIKTRHIPVHMMSGEGDTLSAQKQGAVGFINKPTTKEKLDKALLNLEGVIEKKIKDLLVIEDDEYLRKSIIELLKAEDVTTYEANTGTQALSIIRDTNIDCIVLDLTLPDMSGYDLLNILKKESELHIPPIIVYTGRDLSKEEEKTIMQFAESIIIKGVKSEERLIDETALFLHRVVDKYVGRSADSIINIHDKDFVFKGKTVLLVDDDNRNSYALSKVMIDKELNVLIADNGANAVDIISQNNNIDLVLMDIMMPVMDGITAIGEIRNSLKLNKLPIIALTAKAMKEDREKCIAAGANDYLSKPIEIDKLFSLLRVWLYK